MIITANIKKDKFFRRYVDIINVLFNLSNRELDILSLLIELDYSWHTDKYKDILDASSRKYIMRETYVNKSNLSRYVSILKDKNILVKNSDDGWEVNKRFIPVIENNHFIITFNIGLEEDNKS
jgi:hypothetical protein